MLRRSLMAMVFAVGAVPLTAQPCLACSCAPRDENQTRQEYREEQAENADVVFTGRVRRIDAENSNVKARFRVGRVYKGTNRDRLTIKTPSSGAACGYHFKDGERYTVFGFGNRPAVFWTYICSGTQKGRIDGERYGFDN